MLRHDLLQERFAEFTLVLVSRDAATHKNFDFLIAQSFSFAFQQFHFVSGGGKNWLQMGRYHLCQYDACNFEIIHTCEGKYFTMI